MKLHEHTLALLRVTAEDGSLSATCKVEIDEYVPLRCSTYDEPIGAGYVRLGNYSTTLIELAVEPRTQILRGVTVTSIEELSPWPEFALTEMLDKVPVLATEFQAYDVVDLQDTFKVAARPGEVVVFWTDLARCIGYRCGGTSFLTVDGVLAGVWFTGLTDEETNLFVSHAGGT
jgi:hypothetical protein